MKLIILDRTDLAVQALRLLADLDGAPSRELAERLGTSSGFLTQILNPLVQAGTLTSSRGPGGGYRFAVDPIGLSILDVIETVEGPTDDGRCVLQDAECPRQELCAMHDAWVSARGSLTDTLAHTPLLDNATRR